jgi:hypothetical protein
VSDDAIRESLERMSLIAQPLVEQYMAEIMAYLNRPDFPADALEVE